MTSSSKPPGTSSPTPTVGGQPVRSIDMTVTLKALAKSRLPRRQGRPPRHPRRPLPRISDRKRWHLPRCQRSPHPGQSRRHHRQHRRLPHQRRQTGDAVWSTRGAWCFLTTGNTNGHTETIAINDNPANPGYPTYWHARGYGLFAANPLGRSIFDPKQPAFNYTLEKDQATTFRYRDPDRLQLCHTRRDEQRGNFLKQNSTLTPQQNLRPQLLTASLTSSSTKIAVFI